MNFVTDPTRFRVTRGTGEHSNVITVREIAVAPGNGLIGWLNPVNNPSGVAAATNGGADIMTNLTYGEAILMLAGVVGYALETIVWNFVWTRLSGSIDPILNSTSWASEGKLSFALHLLTSSGATGHGVLTATIDGVPAGNTLILDITAADAPGTVFWDQL